MVNPILAEVIRGSRVESIHRGALVIVDAAGKIIMQRGDAEAIAYPRSSLKLLQALPLLESGAAEAFGFSNRELALACASHSSSPTHVGIVGGMLERAGLGETDLQCGAHWPVYATKDVIAMVRRGETPNRMHNNCSGKHAGFLCTCAHTGVSTGDYIDPENHLQKEVRAVIGALCGTVIDDAACGLDGCSAPTFAVPIKGMAHAHAKLAAGVGVEPARAKAARRLLQACMAEPHLVADEGRYCTLLMQAAPGRLYAKTGAEGFFIAAVPEQGIAIAVKCDDGASRAAEVAVAAAIAASLAARATSYT
ncbi:MAG: asparaginase [Pseudomonadota bacterium]